MRGGHRERDLRKGDMRRRYGRRMRGKREGGRGGDMGKGKVREKE